MTIVINGTTGITDADGGTVLNTSDLASQAQAVAGTDNATLVTPLRLRDGLNATGSAPIYAARAHGYILSGSVVAGQNVSSYNQSTGVVTLTTAMATSTYTVVAVGDGLGGTLVDLKTTTSFRLSAYSSGGNLNTRSTASFNFIVMGA
jgi:hypothetical protein